MEKKIVGMVSVMILICANYAWPQDIYPPTVKHPVTFYDFHSDGTNPEFEQPHMAGIHSGMAAEVLDSEKKPLLGTSPYLNYGIAKWFRPWQQGDFAVPKYLKQSGGEFDAVMTYAGMITINYDTSFKNFTIQDSLEFQSVIGSPGIFQYSNANFFPLDGKGLGNEGENHNYSFAMEFHDSVFLTGGLTLTFGGDDDIWVFINNRLAVDLGGIHLPETTKVALDTVKGLTMGKMYPLDVYYAERHSTASSVILSWFIIDKPLFKLSMNVIPPVDTVSAGDSVKLSAVIFDDTNGVHTPEYETDISWTIFPADNFSWVAPAIGSKVTFHGNAGYRTYKVFARFTDPKTARIISDSVWIYVKPGPVRQLFIEPYTAAISPVPNPVDSIVLGDFPAEKEIYAVLRDAYGGFAGFDTNVTWEELGDSGIVKLTTTAHPYICLVEKIRQGTTYVLCKSGGSTVGTVKVMVRPGTKVVNPVTSSALQKPAKATEYFNLRGQKLPLYGIRHADGIVLERIIQPDGKANFRKIIPEIKSR
jgi:fibro-slime domain-containing protein